MKIKKGYILFLLIGLFYSCRQEKLPEPNNGTPIFTVTGTLGGNLIDIKAGDDDFYMFTEFEKDETNVFTFSGTFAKLEPDCDSSCNEKLRISIRDFEMTEGDVVIDIESSLRLGDYEYDNGTGESFAQDTSYDVTFVNKSITSSGEALYTWNFSPPNKDSFNIETFGEFSVPEPMNFKTLDFPVSLSRINFDPFVSCSNYTKLLSLSNNDCSGSIVVTSDSILGLLNIGIEDSLNLVEVGWLGEGSFGGVDLFGSNVTIDTSGRYCAVSQFPNGCVDTVCIDVDFLEVQEQNDYCSLAFDYIIESKYDTIIVPEDPFRFSEILIEYVDEEGLSFRSDLGPQLDESQFEIVEVTDFEDNENGEKTKQLKIRFNCVLYKETDLSWTFENAEVVMAVAYPGR